MGPTKSRYIECILVLKYNVLFSCFPFEVPGPADWHKVAPQCAGLAQSPIDLDRYSLKTNVWEENLTIQFDNDDGLVAGTLINNGHVPILAVDKSLGSATLSGGPVGNSCINWNNSSFILDIHRFKDLSTLFLAVHIPSRYQ